MKQLIINNHRKLELEAYSTCVDAYYLNEQADPYYSDSWEVVEIDRNQAQEIINFLQEFLDD